jgi:8-oxo-dGTP pyrophosphatase MutT (NUDIX family)
MKFKNRPNKSYKVKEDGKDKLVWESRSVAVNGVILARKLGESTIFVLSSKRGPNSSDFQGKMNLIAGYLDWDETGSEALYRESWEEVGINIPKILEENWILKNNLFQPWHVKTSPDENRQNISLRYGLFFETKKGMDLPELSLENNEVEGEVEEAKWIPVSEVSNYEWAFGHDLVIHEYLKLVR